MSKCAHVICLFVALAVMSPMAHANDYADGYNNEVVSDPLEPVNRAIFTFNDVLDTILIRPLAIAYHFVFPEPVREGVHNALGNLKAPIVLANELLQGDFEGADVVTRRFVFNTTLGLGGLIDVAEMHGLPANDPEDFGQTLASWGVGSGPYLVLPVLGPSNMRDVVGDVVDGIADPWNAYARSHDGDEFMIGRSVLTALDKRSRNLKTYDDLKESSVDLYATMRSIYDQRREILISDGGGEFDIPDYDAVDDATDRNLNQ